MRILITGVTGNAGTALVRRLAGAGDVDLVGLSRRPPGAEVGAALTRWYGADLGHPSSAPVLATAMTGCDAVVHLAWQIQPSHDRTRMRATNVGGATQVLEAATASEVPHVVHASSVGAYAPGPKSERVSEDWLTTGVPGSSYSDDKAEVESLLDRYETSHPELMVTRMRPGLIFQRSAASEIARYFLGPLVPAQLVRRVRLPGLPLSRELVFQAVHADDVADAFERAVRRGVPGAFNIAAEPALGPHDVAAALGARAVWPTPAPVLKAVAAATWRLRLQPTEAGWLELATRSPLMSTQRAADELGWEPKVDARDALAELLEGFTAGAAGATPPLRSRRHQRWSTT
jgi:nucleoside-diphosphate-sugar epimerase